MCMVVDLIAEKFFHVFGVVGIRETWATSLASTYQKATKAPGKQVAPQLPKTYDRGISHRDDRNALSVPFFSSKGAAMAILVARFTREQRTSTAIWPRPAYLRMACIVLVAAICTAKTAIAQNQRDKPASTLPTIVAGATGEDPATATPPSKSASTRLIHPAVLKA